jgi:hypothetical protein
MSVRSDLEELAKWISDLSEKEKPATPSPRPRESWRAVGRNLTAAVVKFATVRRKLLAQDEGKVLSEFALDVQREAEALALQAYMLSRRAKSEPAKRRTATAAAAKEVQAKAKRPAKPSAPEEPHEEDERSPAQLAKAAQRTVETAHEKLGPVKDQDAATKAFAQELDLLAEMTLHLAQQCAQLNDAEDEERIQDAEEEERLKDAEEQERLNDAEEELLNDVEHGVLNDAEEER